MRPLKLNGFRFHIRPYLRIRRAVALLNFVISNHRFKSIASVPTASGVRMRSGNSNLRPIAFEIMA
jgi:hypothetical protein